MSNLCADNVGARVQREDVADARLALPLQHDHVGDLDHRVNLGLGEHTLAARALNVKAQHAKGSHLSNHKREREMEREGEGERERERGRGREGEGEREGGGKGERVSER